MIPPERFNFAAMDPHDGFRIVKVKTVTGAMSLHLVFKSQDELRNLHTIGEREEDGTMQLAVFDNTPVGNGQCQRLELVANAICSYMNACGNLDGLMNLLKLFKQFVPMQMHYPGWSPESTLMVYDEELERVLCQHIFVSSDLQRNETAAVVWAEDVFVDVTTVGKIIEEADDAEGLGGRFVP